MKLRGSNSGAVLVVVLGILALLTLIAVSFVFATRMSLRASEAYMRTVTASDVAEAGLANAIAVLKADKIYRTGDPLDPTVPITETFDSLVDKWRTEFTAPVIITYDDSLGSEADLAAGDTITNMETASPGYLATGKVISVDTANNRLYLNSISTGMWQAGAPGDRVVEQGGAFDATISAVSKPDEVDLDGDGTNDAIWRNYYDESGALLGRYAVLVQDESSKININMAGNLSDIPNTEAAALVYSNYGHSQNEGWSPFEIDLAAGLNTTAPNAQTIVLYRGGLSVASANRTVFSEIQYTPTVGAPLAGDTITNNTAPHTGETGTAFFVDSGNGMMLVKDIDPDQPIGKWETGNQIQNGAGFIGTIDSVIGGVSRVFVGGQGDLVTVDSPGTPATFDDDDDNYNRVFYRYDGIDNDGDGAGDEQDEGINEPEESRPLRPYRPASLSLDYNRFDDDNDAIEDETNEADDQPILTLEQLADSEGVNLGDAFLTNSLSTNYDGSTNTNRERRNFISTNSFDRNLNKDGELRVNPNFSTPDQNVATVHAAFPATGTGDTDAFERPDLRNMQVAANIYDYRDRNNFRNEITDTAGDVFAGVEAIRINEVLARAATNLYEAEDPVLVIGTPSWMVGTPTGPTSGAITPRGAEGFLTDPGAVNNLTTDVTGGQTITLPNPPFSPSSTYVFKLRMRVRNDGTVPTAPNDMGFRVWIQDAMGTTRLVTDARLGADPNSPPGGVPGAFTPTTNPLCRWSTVTQPPAPNGYNRWYVEEATQMLDALGVATNLTLSGGANMIWLEKPALTGGGNQDTVDVDWFFFTQEPDCEWIELVNLGNEIVNVNNWTLVSEYTEDWSMVAANPPIPPAASVSAYNPASGQYYLETYQLTLPNVGMLPVDDPTPNTPAPPQHYVFVIDEDDTNGSTATITNGIYFNSTWSNLTGSANIHQFTSITNIYTTWVDFFGNEPLDNPWNNATSNVRGTAPTSDDVTSNIEVARISLYDADGRLVDCVTYDAGNVTEVFASLQREHAGSPGDRLDQNQNFKMRSYIAPPFLSAPYNGSTMLPLNVTSDGNYDDWKFWNDPWLTNTSLDGSLSTSEFIGWTPNSRGSSGFMTPAEENNRSANYSERVATAESAIKNRLFSNVGEIANMPFYNEFFALIGFQLRTGSANDDTLIPGASVITNTYKTPQQTAALVSIHIATGGLEYAPDGWMVVRGDYANPVNTWNLNETITSGGFSADIKSIKALDTTLGDQLDFYVEIEYANNTNDPSVGDTITNTSKNPDQTGTVTQVDTTSKIIQLVMDPANPVARWEKGENIDNGGTFTADIASVREKSADARGLVDYLSTSMIDLEAASGQLQAGGSGYTAVNWPNADNPTVYRVAAGAGADFELKWDEDDGVREGTYNLYSIVNYGSTIESESPIFVGPITTEKDATTQQAIISLTIQNAGAAAAQHHFMRAILAPPPETFGRININTASRQVLQGLRLELPDPNNPGQAATYTPTKAEFADAIIRARNIEAFQSIGDLYRVSEQLTPLTGQLYGFTPDVFANVSNLMTTRSDIYKIIVLGQAATDANKNGIIENDEITSEKKLEMIYQR